MYEFNTYTDKQLFSPICDVITCQVEQWPKLAFLSIPLITHEDAYRAHHYNAILENIIKWYSLSDKFAMLQIFFFVSYANMYFVPCSKH